MIKEKAEEILKKARELKGLTQTEMAFKLATSLNQTYSLRQYQRLEEGLFPKFKTEVVIAIDKILKTSLYDIIYDKNVSRDTTLQEGETDYNTPEGVTLIDTLAGTKDYLKKRRELKNHTGPYMVPLVPIPAQAGYVKHFYDIAYIEKLETYPILPGVDPHGASWRYFQVQGDSMLDTLMNEQFILTSQVIKEDWRNVETSYIYVIITLDGVMVKRLYKVKGKDYWAAVSDNPDEIKFPQFRVYVKDVLELWKFRRKVEWNAPAPRKVEIKV